MLPREHIMIRWPRAWGNLLGVDEGQGGAANEE